MKENVNTVQKHFKNMPVQDYLWVIFKDGWLGTYLEFKPLYLIIQLIYVYYSYLANQQALKIMVFKVKVFWEAL